MTPPVSKSAPVASHTVTKGKKTVNTHTHTATHTTERVYFSVRDDIFPRTSSSAAGLALWKPSYSHQTYQWDRCSLVSNQPSSGSLHQYDVSQHCAARVLHTGISLCCTVVWTQTILSQQPGRFVVWPMLTSSLRLKLFSPLQPQRG